MDAKKRFPQRKRFFHAQTKAAPRRAPAKRAGLQPDEASLSSYSLTLILPPLLPAL